MTGPGLGVDTAALEAVAREFTQLSGDLTHDGTVHEAAPAPDQPSGQAVSALTASANHMTNVCADHLIGFAESIAAAAAAYAATDAGGAERLSTTMPK